MDTSFFDLGVDPALVKTLEKQGISEPFEVQLEAISSDIAEIKDMVRELK